MIIELEVQEGIHIKPKLFNLNFGGFQKVAVCEDCKMHIADNSINSYAPCENCGGSFSGLKSFTGIYKNGKWCKKLSNKEEYSMSWGGLI